MNNRLLRFLTSLCISACTIGFRPILGVALFEFTTVDYDWPNASVRAAYLSSGDYVPEACQPSSLKVGGPDQIFVTVPRLRYKDGVPASLNTVHAKSPGSKDAVFRPYPDWETNKVGNCSALQLPPSLAFDDKEDGHQQNLFITLETRSYEDSRLPVSAAMTPDDATKAFLRLDALYYFQKDMEKFLCYKVEYSVISDTVVVDNIANFIVRDLNFIVKTGYLYVIDVGRVGIWSPTTPSANLCPAKIVVFDTRQGGRVVRSHDFPDYVAPRTTNFLNDIVLDYVDPDQPTEVKYAYISDPSSEQLVVFDFTSNTSWSFKDANSMKPDSDSNITIQGRSYTFSMGIDGIALSPTFNYVYYTAVGSKKLWQIPTWVLRNKNSDFSGNVRLVGNKKSNADGILFGHRGLYYGALGLDAVYKWDIEKDILLQGVSEGEVKLITDTPVAQNWETMQWPDGFGFGNPDTENLYFITNRAHLYHDGTLDFSGGHGPNFRIFKVPVNDSSYLTSPHRNFPYMSIIG